MIVSEPLPAFKIAPPEELVATLDDSVLLMIVSGPLLDLWIAPPSFAARLDESILSMIVTEPELPSM